MSTCPILVATDLRPRSDRAVDRALILGEQLGRKVCVIHVLEGDTEVGEKEVREVLPASGAETEIMMPSGSPTEVIPQMANECDAAMIVTAVARFNNISDFVTGTAVDRVIDRGGLPVLVVKKRPHGRYERLLVTTDFSDPAQHALVVAMDLFPHAQIDVLHAYRAPYEDAQTSEHSRSEAQSACREEMDEFLAKAGKSIPLGDRVKAHFGYGDIGMVLPGMVAELKPDLIVAGTHGKSGWRRMALGSVASSMLGWVKEDMLIVPHGD